MSDRAWTDDPLRQWIGVGAGMLGALVLGSVMFPRQVYGGFIWRYFWGPVVADANGVGTDGCAVRNGDVVSIHTSASECLSATGFVAHPGYTTVSTLSYAIVLLFALIGVWLFFDRFGIEIDRELFYALTPFVFFGGALRVFEDANATVFQLTDQMIVPLPWVGLLIAPLIYVTVFLIAVAAMAVGVGLHRWSSVERSASPVAVIGTASLVATVGALATLSTSYDPIGFNLLMPLITLGGATVIAGITWVLTERFFPDVNVGTGYMGIVIVWGHAVDGIANVVSLDWAHVVGLSQGYAPKHVVNRLVIRLAEIVQPQVLTDVIGTAWPFLLLKVSVAVIVVWLFDDEVLEESPQFSYLLLIAVLAVGLGPGTRDFLRATLGI